MVQQIVTVIILFVANFSFGKSNSSLETQLNQMKKQCIESYVFKYYKYESKQQHNSYFKPKAILTGSFNSVEECNKERMNLHRDYRPYGRFEKCEYVYQGPELSVKVPAVKIKDSKGFIGMENLEKSLYFKNIPSCKEITSEEFYIVNMPSYKSHQKVLSEMPKKGDFYTKAITKKCHMSKFVVCSKNKTGGGAEIPDFVEDFISKSKK